MDQSALATPKTIKRLCPRCNLYTTEAIHVHLKKCTQCQRCGRYKTHLKVHLQTCKGVGKVQRVTCPVCPRTYHPRSLGRHLRKEHPTEIWTSGSRKHRKETVQCVKGREQVSHCNHNNYFLVSFPKIIICNLRTLLILYALSVPYNPLLFL
jgi:hypothetical protein